MDDAGPQEPSSGLYWSLLVALVGAILVGIAWFSSVATWVALVGSVLLLAGALAYATFAYRWSRSSGQSMSRSLWVALRRLLSMLRDVTP